jgi:hypothetical protein
VRRLSYLAPVILAGVGVLQQPPVLNADSLYDLHDSADRVKLSLSLTRDEYATLERALDVMVGDDARRLMDSLDASPRPLPASVRLAAEARVLAPVRGMTYDRLVHAAADKTRDRRAGLLGELRAERAAAPTSRQQLQKIEVVDAAYWSSVATGERAVDFTLFNGTDQALSALLLDCRLIDPERRQTREHGACRAEFDRPLAAGASATVTAEVDWESRQRLHWVTEATPIRAYGLDGKLLWEVASELEAGHGHLAEIESRIAALDDDLESLHADRYARP